MFGALIGVPSTYLAVVIAAMHGGAGYQFGFLTKRAMVKWGGVSNAAMALTGLWWAGAEDEHLIAAVSAVSCVSMGTVAGLHAARIAGTATATEAMVAKAAAGGFGFMALDQTLVAWRTRS